MSGRDGGDRRVVVKENGGGLDDAFRAFDRWGTPGSYGAHLVMVPSALPKMFLATSSKQSASSIRDAAAAMVVVGEPDSVRLFHEPMTSCFWHRNGVVFTV